jgi:hypothetical protein
MGDDVQQLKLLALFHYIVGGLLALFAFFPGIYLAMGILMVTAPASMSGGGAPPPRFMGWGFIIFSSLAMLVCWVFAGCIALAGWYLTRRKHRTFCMVAAALACLWTPFGTVLGIFTLIVLLRPSVIELFEERKRLDAPADVPPLDALAERPPQPEGPDVRVRPESGPGPGW